MKQLNKTHSIQSIMRPMGEPVKKKQFTLGDAQQLLPTVRERTADAVERAEHLSKTLDDLPVSDPRRTEMLTKLDEVCAVWASEMNTLGVVVKGLWLVDFDGGDGYYCWKYPETAVSHYHGYDDGFSGRMKII